MSKRIIISVINDLVTDQRVQRVAKTLSAEGYEIMLVGRKLRGSFSKDRIGFRSKRFRMVFRKGPFFYAFYNIRLFLYLMVTSRPQVLIAVDLDTLSANYLASNWRNIPLIYDSHEYFTEVPELIGRKTVKRIWERIEERILPEIRYAMTVSEPIARTYQEKYGTPFTVVRNLPEPKEPVSYPEFQDTYPSRFKIIYQGALNKGRGLEMLIYAMKYMTDTSLLLAGDGDVRQKLQELVLKEQLSGKVYFIGRIPPDSLHRITCQSDLGVTLEEDLGMNYRYALPNKLFDYIQARIPVLCSDLPEMRNIVVQYGVGEVCLDRDPGKLAGQISEMLHSEELNKTWEQNLENAAGLLHWENEKDRLMEIVRTADR